MSEGITRRIVFILALTQNGHNRLVRRVRPSLLMQQLFVVDSA